MLPLLNKVFLSVWSISTNATFWTCRKSVSFPLLLWFCKNLKGFLEIDFPLTKYILELFIHWCTSAKLSFDFWDGRKWCNQWSNNFKRFPYLPCWKQCCNFVENQDTTTPNQSTNLGLNQRCSAYSGLEKALLERRVAPRFTVAL